MPASFDPQPPRFYHAFTVHSQPNDCGASDGCAALHPNAVLTPGKMRFPTLAAGVEQRCLLTGLGIDSALKRKFEAVAPDTGEAQIVQARCAACGLRSDMVHFHFHHDGLGRSTVLASTFRASDNLLP